MEDSLKLVILLYISTLFSIVFDIPVLRQVFGFIFLSFIPGFLFLKILKLSEGDRLQQVILSAGLSVAFLMFLGLLLNGISPAFDLSMPLSIMPLMITINGSTLVLLLLSWRRKDQEASFSFSGRLNSTTFLQICFVLVLPVTSIVGALYHNTLLLLLMILGVAILYVISIFSNRILPEKFFPLAIASISISLLLHTVLISKYFMGSQDGFSEFYVFKLTESAGYWNAPGSIISYTLIDSLNSLVSITILPTIYTVLLGIDGEIFFKLFYPFLFSLVPLALYQLFEKQTGKKIALLSVFFVVSISIAFYGLEPLSLTRQITGQFFLVLSILLITQKELPPVKSRILLMVFGAAIVVSHYSLAYIFLFYIAAFFILSRFSILPYRKGSLVVLTYGIALFLIAFTFFWYVYVSNSPLNQLANSINNIVRWFSTDIFSSQARGFEGALSSLSPFAATSLVGIVHKGLIYLAHFFIGIGILVLIIKPKKFKLNNEFQLVAVISMAILVLCLVIPNVAPSLNLTRFYAIIIPFVAPFFVLGGTFLFSQIRKLISKPLFKSTKFPLKNLELKIVTLLLVAIFLFQVGFVNHVFGDYPYSYSLDLDRKEKSSDVRIQIATHTLYFLDQEVSSAKWLRENINSTFRVYADWNSQVTVLKSYALLPNDKMLQITNGTIQSPTYVYMKYLNVRLGLISTENSDLFNVSDVSNFLGNCSKVYSNGDSDIYFAP